MSRRSPKSRTLRSAVVGVPLAAAVVAAAFAGTAGTASAADPKSAANWTSAGHDSHNTRNAASEHIVNAKNVKNLKARWTFTAGGDISATPTVVDGVAYVPDWSGKLHAVNTKTGKAAWSKPVSTYSGIEGDVSRTSPAYEDGKLVFGEGVPSMKTTAGAYLLGAAAKTGAPLWKTQIDDHEAALVTGSPVIADGVAYVGVSSKSEGMPGEPTFRGSVAAVSVDTGKILWKTHTVPKGYTGGAVWGSHPAVDLERGLVYVATGNNYSVPEGVCETPDATGCTPASPDNHQDSIVALDLKDGKVAWARHTLEADQWTIEKPNGPDYDFGSGPNLYTTTVDGKRTDLLGVGQKSGVYWALDPATGKVVWQTQAGPGGLGGGIQWGSATDGKRIYVAVTNYDNVPTTITSATGEKSTTKGGFWAALDAATGKLLWQTADPQGHKAHGFVTSANGVVYGGSMAPKGNNMYALDAATGKVKWGFASGGSVVGGAAVVNGSVYWGSGYTSAMWPDKGTNNKLYAFSVGKGSKN
ncbi:outer membrane protein assembly factor BamB family protein [Streptomyces sp. JNUCC 63]